MNHNALVLPCLGRHLSRDAVGLTHGPSHWPPLNGSAVGTRSRGASVGSATWKSIHRLREVWLHLLQPRVLASDLEFSR